MKPTAEILASISQNSRSHPEEVFTRLYRYMLRPDIYFLAYKHLYANNGAATPGVDKDDTADGFSEAKIARIIESLKDGSYQPDLYAAHTLIKRTEAARSDRWDCPDLQISWFRKLSG